MELGFLIMFNIMQDHEIVWPSSIFSVKGNLLSAEISDFDGFWPFYRSGSAPSAPIPFSLSN